MISSDLPSPYVSAVSANVPPASTKRSSCSCAPCSSVPTPKVMVPRQRVDTARPGRYAPKCDSPWFNLTIAALLSHLIPRAAVRMAVPHDSADVVDRADRSEPGSGIPPQGERASCGRVPPSAPAQRRFAEIRSLLGCSRGGSGTCRTCACRSSGWIRQPRLVREGVRAAGQRDGRFVRSPAMAML